MNPAAITTALAATAARHAAALPARARHGRPWRVTTRAIIATAIAATAATAIPGTPAAPAICAGAALWLALTLPPDLAPGQPSPARRNP